MGDMADFTQNTTFISGAISIPERRFETAVKYILTILNAISQLREYGTLVAEQARRSREGDAEMASKLEAMFKINLACQGCLSLLLLPLNPELSGSEVLDIVDDMSHYSKETQVEFAKTILGKYTEGIAGPTRGGLFTELVTLELRDYKENSFEPRISEFTQNYQDDIYFTMVLKKVIETVKALADLDDAQRRSANF